MTYDPKQNNSGIYDWNFCLVKIIRVCDEN